MKDMNTLDRERSPSRITEEERRLIDDAVAAGKVTQVPTGASAFSQDYIWSHGMKLVPVETSETQKPGYAWRRDFSSSARLARGRKRKNEVSP